MLGCSIIASVMESSGFSSELELLEQLRKGGLGILPIFQFGSTLLKLKNSLVISRSYEDEKDSMSTL